MRTLRPHEVADRETELVGSRPLVLPASRAGHVQHLHAGFVRHAVDSAYAERVEPVFLRHAEAVTIELGQSAGAGPDRQACRTQGFEKRPPGGVDRCGVSQWCLEPLSNAGQKLGLPFEEFLNRPGPLLLVAFDARDRQIGKTVGTASRLRNDVLHVERHTALCAVDAPASELLQEVLLEFIAGKFALLILDAGDLRVLHPLRVKLHEFLSNPAHGRKPAKTVDPGERRVDAVLKRRRQPSLRFASIQEPGSAIAEIAAPAAAPQLTPRRQGVSDRGSAVLEISASDRSTMRIVKGCSLCTRALPAFRSFLALAGPQGISGLWSLSRTKTFIMFVYLTVTDELLAERAVPNRDVPLAISGPPLDCQGVRANFFYIMP